MTAQQNIIKRLHTTVSNYKVWKYQHMDSFAILAEGEIYGLIFALKQLGIQAAYHNTDDGIAVTINGEPI